MHSRRLIATLGAAVVTAGVGAAGARAGDMSPRSSAPGGSITLTRAGRPARPDRADWQRIQAAAGLRRSALAPRRSVRFRAFAAFLGLSELVTIQPLGPGPCATAVTYLYDNLLDLQDATAGENWTPLRRAVAREPSIRACAPRQPRRLGP